jgi:hypothetical protein
MLYAFCFTLLNSHSQESEARTNHESTKNGKGVYETLSSFVFSSLRAFVMALGFAFCHWFLALCSLLLAPGSSLPSLPA